MNQPQLQLIPQPANVAVSSGFFKPGSNPPITIKTDHPEYSDEEYSLIIDPAAITIHAAHPAGIFYAHQTLFQVIATQSSNGIPCLKIHDKPRYRWRGIMLDVGRHLYSMDYLKKFIDLMASCKLNTLHWHLTEDQGWRIEIKKHPRLTEIGAWRENADGTRYAGFYTQDQIRELVQYAAERFITIVPEIELPGHALAALAAYPHLSCSGGPFKITDTWGVYQDVYCAGKEATFTFLEDVLTEVLELFPSTFIHIGGDECPKKRWETCPDCQARIKTQGLHDEHELQSYFVKRFDTFLTDRGRRLIGWDEILEGGLAANAAVMAWRNPQGAINAARTGHDVVMSPVTHCYLDYYQSKSPGQPKAIGGFLPIETVYDFDPTPDDLTPDDAKHILGGQGNIWTEYMPTEQQVDYMAFPRTLALAEALWSKKEGKNWADFSNRLPAHLDRLRALGVNYFVEPPTASG
jgi:hexosaminidase